MSIEIQKDDMTETRTFRTPGVYTAGIEEYPFDIVEIVYDACPWQPRRHVDWDDGEPENWQEVQGKILKQFLNK